MNYQIVHQTEESRFAVYLEDGQLVGELGYQLMDGGVIRAYTTHLEPKMRGSGAAGKLVDQLVIFARNNHFKIIPECPYLAHIFHKKPEAYQDLLQLLEP